VDITDLMRRTRNTAMQKQEKINHLNRKPVQAEGSDGDMAIFNNSLFVKVDNAWIEFIAKSKFPVDILADLTYAATGMDGSTDMSAAEGAKIVADLAGLKQKINEIITLLQLNIR